MLLPFVFQHPIAAAAPAALSGAAGFVAAVGALGLEFSDIGIAAGATTMAFLAALLFLRMVTSGGQLILSSRKDLSATMQWRLERAEERADDEQKRADQERALRIKTAELAEQERKAFKEQIKTLESQVAEMKARTGPSAASKLAKLEPNEPLGGSLRRAFPDPEEKDDQDG